MSTPQDPEDAPPNSPARKAMHAVKRFMARDSREHLWAFLDMLDARPLLKRSLIFGAPALALAVGLGVFGYQHWTRTNAARIARQWLDAGRLDRAGKAVQNAIDSEPDQPLSWRLASELAWRIGDKPASVEYAKNAADVGGYQVDDVLAWAEVSILSNDEKHIHEALTYLDLVAARESPRALRLFGEIARRRQGFTDARDQFKAALAADIQAGTPSLVMDEVPLGIVCLQTGNASDRAWGRALLGKWCADATWGAEALRALLADAEAHDDRAGAVRWAEALSLHPRCTLGDIPVCMNALAEDAPSQYQILLTSIEAKSADNPVRAAQLLGWLTQIGQGSEAVRWGHTLEPIVAHRPPVAPGIAEALRATRRWADLQAWVDPGDWGRKLEFLRLAYAVTAARELGDGPRADALWRSLYSEGSLNGAHALFAGDSLYAWGDPKEAADLLWLAADRADLAYQALGSLARLYQVQHDAVGQYRAFSRLYAMRPSDRKIANNLAYFAALTELGSQTHIEQIARDNFVQEPGNPTYRSTYAFVLVWASQANQAMTVIEPVARDWKQSPAVAFAYGATLAGLGRKDEAREIFESLDARTLTAEERDWIAKALRH